MLWAEKVPLGEYKVVLTEDGSVPISGSVGSNGKNAPGDVMYVQILLNDWNARNNISLITIDGLIGPETIGAISVFQDQNAPVTDGRVDPNGATLAAIEGLHLTGVLSSVVWNQSMRAYLQKSGSSGPLAVQRLHQEYLKLLRKNLS
jgi:peptidoglycan hydrolase-like protein with peptidoglycan-binding domain